MSLRQEMKRAMMSLLIFRTCLILMMMPRRTKGLLNLYGLSASGRDLENLLDVWGEKKYRAKQIREWVYEYGVTEYEKMSNIPKSLREKLKEHVATNSLEIAAEEQSKDGTVKRAYLLEDNLAMESVLMRYKKRNTACVSSQAGCAMGCVFCATGQMGFRRQLTATEIFEQIARYDAHLKKEDQRLSNVVYMGMGEPLLNYKEVSKSLSMVQDYLGIGARKITVSTVGVVPNIAKLSEDHPNVGLAISLHAATDEARTALLPANARYGGLDALMRAAQTHFEVTGRRVSFEWALVSHVNDDLLTARTLGNLLSTYRLSSAAHVNLIPLNPTDDFKGKSSLRAPAFANCLISEFGISATVRMRRGIDIDAGCGMLANKLLPSSSSSSSLDTTHNIPIFHDDDGLILPEEVSSSDDHEGVAAVVDNEKKIEQLVL